MKNGQEIRKAKKTRKDKKQFSIEITKTTNK